MRYDILDAARLERVTVCADNLVLQCRRIPLIGIPGEYLNGGEPVQLATLHRAMHATRRGDVSADQQIGTLLHGASDSLYLWTRLPRPLPDHAEPLARTCCFT